MSERRPKKRPNVFAQVVANADEVVQASFIAAGPAPTAVSAAEVSGDTSAAVTASEPPATASVPPQEPEPVVQVSAPVPALPKPTAEPALAQHTDELPAAAATAPTAPAQPQTRPPVASAPVPEAVRPSTPTLMSAPTAPTAPVEPQNSRSVEKPITAPPAPEPEPALKVAPRRRPVTARRTDQQHWSHRAVFESFASATIESKNWRLHGFRIVPDVLAQLKTRINADRRSSGNAKLAISHYLDAALRHASTDVDEQVALAQEFLTARMGMVEAGKQSTYRVGLQASTWVADLNVGLQEADYGRKGIYVVSASIESFLDALDGGGTLLRPELPGVR